jgi:molybdopterin-guanine dinucleotide biosynthesis protein MobB
VKHTHHSVDLDRPGKDTYRHREAGAREVMLVSSARWALMHETRDGPAITLGEIMGRMEPVDILLVEGFKAWPHDKIEIHRREVGGEIMALANDTIKAVVSDAPLVELSIPLFELDAVDDVARFILDRAAKADG